LRCDVHRTRPSGILTNVPPDISPSVPPLAAPATIPATRAETWRRIGMYLGIVVAISAVFNVLIIRSGTLGVAMGMYTTSLMWAPGIAALLTCKLTGMPASELGWRWPAWREVRFAWLLPIGYATITYAVIWISGGGGFPNPTQVAQLEKSMDLAGYPAPLVIGVFVLVIGTVGMVRGMTGGLGEEIGWRGFLVPQLAKVMGFRAVVFVSGTIWLLYHVPVLLFADYNSGTPWWFGLTCFAFAVYGISAVMAAQRLRSGSLWPAAIMHASHNLIVQAVLTPLTTDTGPTEWLVDEFGIGLAVSIGLVGAWTMWKERARG
jgi:membrane protease YdiL (CAAX protease family)